MNMTAPATSRSAFPGLVPSPVKSGDRASTTPIAPQAPTEQPSRPESTHPFAEVLRQFHGPAPAPASEAAAPASPSAKPAADAKAADATEADASAASPAAAAAAADAAAVAADAAAAKVRARLAPPPGKPSAREAVADAALPEATEAAKNPKVVNDDDRPGPRGGEGAVAAEVPVGLAAPAAPPIAPPIALPAGAAAGAAGGAAAGAAEPIGTGAGAKPAADPVASIGTSTEANAAASTAPSTPWHKGPATSAAANHPSAADADTGKADRHRLSAGEAAREPGFATARSAAAAVEAASGRAGSADAPVRASAVPVPGSEGVGALAGLAAPAPAPFVVTPPAAAAPAQASVAVPLDAPGFAAAFGVQVSVLAKDGVQHAELHLNPAETGPVSIRIHVEGSQARIDFGADLAATRQAIETSLPQLASALSEAGFTLAGGGVSQHAGSQAGSGNAGEREAGAQAQGGSGRRVGGGAAAPLAAPAAPVAKLPCGPAPGRPPAASTSTPEPGFRCAEGSRLDRQRPRLSPLRADPRFP